MGHHHKAASCSALPSFQSFTSISTNSTKAPSLFDNEYKPHQQSTSSISTGNLKRSISPLPTSSITRRSNANENTFTDNQQPQFPLPSFCLYSTRALANEDAQESDIIQFLSPWSNVLEERLPMFVGVLQSLFTVVNDMPFINEDTDDDENDDISCSDTEEEEEEEEGKQDDRRDGKVLELPFTIIGLNSMKFVIWSNMCDNIMDKDNIYEKDLCLVIIVSNQISDITVLQNMNSLRRSVYGTFSNTTDVPVTANEMGEHLIPLIDCWFDTTTP